MPYLQVVASDLLELPAVGVLGLKLLVAASALPKLPVVASALLKPQAVFAVVAVATLELWLPVVVVVATAVTQLPVVAAASAVP